MIVLDWNKIDQNTASLVRFPTMELHMKDSAYSGKAPEWGHALAKRLQNKSYLLVTTPTPLTKQAEEREAKNVNASALTRHHEPERALNGKQKSALCEEMRAFVNEDMDTTVPRNLKIQWEIDHEGIDSSRLPISYQCVARMTIQIQRILDKLA